MADELPDRSGGRCTLPAQKLIKNVKVKCRICMNMYEYVDTNVTYSEIPEIPASL
jgi:hypothetical protein